MNIKITPKLLSRMAIGLVITLLFSMGTPAVRSTSANAFSMDRKKDLTATSKIQVNHDIEFDVKLTQFEGFLAEMQQELAIPGMSAAIIKDQELIWAQGFGYADTEVGRPAAPETPYEIASLTKPISSAILLRLVEQGKVNLEDPVSKYGIHIQSPGMIRVKHLLGHTSTVGEPGSVFGYDGSRYGYLQKVIERASGKPFASLMIETLLNPLEMSDSAPIDMLGQPAYAHIKEKLSKPYGGDQTYEDRISTASGLVTTVLDLAKFDIALDQDQLIKPETKAQAFTPQTLSSGDPPVYGLGWFVQDFQGTRIIYHFGYDAFSHLFLKFVYQGYTLILFTNSSTIAYFISPQDKNILYVPAALAFYKLFILGVGLDDPVDWDADEEMIAAQLQAAQAAGTSEIARQEIYDRYLTNRILEKKAAAQEALNTYTRFYATLQPPDFTDQTPIAKIDRIGNNAYSIIEFTLQQNTRVDIYAVGEYWLGKMVDYGGIEDISSGKLIWVMMPEQTSPAGGCAINRQATDQLDLQAGTYRLHYRTDWGHSFDNWVALPPDNLFWGIALYSVVGDASVATRAIIPAVKDELLAGLLPFTDTPIISNLEYTILWICLGILLSVLIVVPVWLCRKKGRSATTKSAWRWTKVGSWVAWVNSLLCLFLAISITMIFGLENAVLYPIYLVSNSGIAERIFTGFSYGCILLAIVQLIFAILAWKGKERLLVERFYYSLVTIAASGFLLLLSTWGMIAAL